MVIDSEKLELIKQNLYEYTEEEVNELYTMTEYAVSLYIPRNHREFEDLTQYAITEFLHNSIKKYDPKRENKLSTFAFTCIDNYVKLYLKNKHDVYSLDFDNERGKEDNKNLSLYNTTPSTFRTPSEEYGELLKENKVIFDAVKANLILNDYYFNGMSQEQIANKLGICQSSVNKKIGKELSKIKKQFNLSEKDMHAVSDKDFYEKRCILKRYYNIDDQIVDDLCQDPILIDYYIENLSSNDISHDLECSDSFVLKLIQKALKEIIHQSLKSEGGKCDEIKLKNKADELWKTLSTYKRFLSNPYKLRFEDIERVQENPVLNDYYIKGLTYEEIQEKYYSKDCVSAQFIIKREVNNLHRRKNFMKDKNIDDRLKDIYDTLNSKTIEAIVEYKLNYNQFQKIKSDPILNDYFINDRSQGEIGKEIGMADSHLSVLIGKKMQKIKEETEQDYKEI